MSLHNQIVAAGLDAQISAHAGNEIRFGWARTRSSTRSSLVPGVDLSSILGSPAPSNESRAAVYLRFPGAGETSAFTDGGRNGLRQIQLRDTFSLQRGPHLLRMGFDLRTLHSSVEPLPWSLEASYLNASAVMSNQASLLVLRRSAPAQPLFHQFAGFVQDTWSLTHHVTLSTGLRWDVDPPPIGADGHDAFHIEGDLKQPQSLAISKRGTGLWSTDRFEVGPRVGAAWQPVREKKREIVVRGGIGIIFDNPNRAAVPAFTVLGFSNTKLLRDTPIPANVSLPDAPTSIDVPYNARLGYLSYLTDGLFGQPILSLNQSYGQSGSLYQPGGPRSLQWMFRVRW